MLRSRSRLHRTLCARVDRVERRRAADVKPIPLLTAETQVSDGLRHVDLAEQVTFGTVAPNAILVRVSPTHGARLLKALIVTLDAVARIREPDRTIGSDCDIV